MTKSKGLPKKIASTPTFTISKIFVSLYLLVGFTPLFGAMDYDAPEWLYVSLINIASLSFIFKNRVEFNSSVLPKHVRLYFYLYLAFFVMGCLSLLTAINVSEGLVHLARLVNIIIATFCLYVFVKQNPKTFFIFICKIVTLIIIYFSWRALAYSFTNYDKGRFSEFISDFPHNFSSINIYTAYLVVQLPFAFYGFFNLDKIWKLIAGFASFMGIFALVFSGSRTALLSLFIISIIFISYSLYSIIRFKAAIKFKIVMIILFTITSILLVINLNRIDKKQSNSISTITQTQSIKPYNTDKKYKNDKSYNFLLEDLPEVETSEAIDAGRVSLWSIAYDNFLDNIYLGIGYGNYKAASKKSHYQNITGKRGFITPRRAHNDFIEKLAETGILGFLLYLALFIFPLILFIKNWRDGKDNEIKWIYLTLLLSGIAYSMDALLNFPLERAPVQMYFIIVVVFILSFYKPGRSTDVKDHKQLILPIFLVMFLGSLVSAYSNYAVLKNYQLQRTMRDDLMGKTLFTDVKLKNSYQDIKSQWLNYPELSYVGTVNNVYLANYAIKDKKYEEALEILNNSQNLNKDAFLVKAFKSEIYLNIYQNADSVKYYSESVFEDYPAFKANYRILKTIYRKEKDTVNIMRVMNRYTNKNWKDDSEWLAKSNMIYSKTKDSELMLKVLDTGLAYNSSSQKLLEAKKEVLDKLKFKSYLSDKEVKAKHQEAFDYFATQEYDKAKGIFNEILKTNPNDYLSIQNIGIIDLVQKNYKEAVKNLSIVIKANAFTDGKAEYSRGYCYEQLGQLEKAKADYKKSRSKNYSQAMALPASKYE